MKEDEIVQACDRYSNETVTLRKHFTKYKNMRKWMVEFLRKSEVVVIKLLEVTQLASAINRFTLICTVVGSVCDADIFKLSACAQSICREVYGPSYSSDRRDCFFLSCPHYFCPYSRFSSYFFIMFFVVFYSCCSHARVSGKTLLHEFHIYL